MMLQLQLQVCRPSGGDTRPAETADIVQLAKRYPQIDSQGKPRWAFGGGAVAKLFGERFPVTTLDGRERKPATDSRRERDCKDLDLCVLSESEDVFVRDNHALPWLPFFRRYMSEDGICIETTRSWFFYSPPPLSDDLVLIDSGDGKAVCVSPEFLSASLFKAVVEGRESNQRDVFDAMTRFQDFDFDRFMRNVSRMPISEAFGIETVRTIIEEIKRENWAHIRDISLERIRSFYSTRIAQGRTYDEMGGQSLGFLSNGIGILASAEERGLGQVPSGIDSEEGFWHSLFQGLQLRRGAIERMLERASDAPIAEFKINNLIAIASTLWKVNALEKSLTYSNHDIERIRETAKRIRNSVILQLQADFDHLHPLKNTFRGLLSVAKDMAKLEWPYDTMFFTKQLPALIRSLTRDAKKIHQLGLYDE